MFKNLFNKKDSIKKISTSHDFDIALRLMIEIALIDGDLDKTELSIIQDRVKKITNTDSEISTIVTKIIGESKNSVSFYPSIRIINETYSSEDKNELMKILWKLVSADSVIDAYEENLIF
jgi:uncharacterized tellurite resistance protein B-like protein